MDRWLRTYGGLPIITKSWKVGDDYLNVPRGTFKETVDFIVADCDAAVALLKSKAEMESGRATNAAALALKSRILLFAASDLTADGTAESKYVGYESPNRTALWTAARDAAKAVIDLNEYKLADFGAPDKDAVAKNYFDFFKQSTLANDELIWGKMFVLDVGDRHSWNVQQGPNGLGCYGSNNPTQASGRCLSDGRMDQPFSTILRWMQMGTIKIRVLQSTDMKVRTMTANQGFTDQFCAIALSGKNDLRILQQGIPLEYMTDEPAE